MEYSRNKSAHNGSIRDEKNALRAEFKEKRRTLTPAARAEMDASVCRQLLSLAAYRYADTVLSYSPIRGEVDITEFNLAVLKSGKRLALPRCIQGQPIMEFRYVDDLSKLQSGEWSIKEPTEEQELWVESKASALCVIPGMAFDRDGYRLGYGKGYYDRFLPSKNLTTVGVVYDGFIVPRLPRGRFDLSVGNVIVGTYFSCRESKQREF